MMRLLIMQFDLDPADLGADLPPISWGGAQRSPA